MTTLRVRETLAGQLAEAGVDVLFGVIGDGNMLFVLDCIEQHAMRFVNARHETAAVLMADAHSRVCGKLAAVTVTHGPGLAAAAVGLGVAAAAGSRLVIVAGDTGRAEALHVQRLDQETFARSLVRDVVSVRTGVGARTWIRRALTRAGSDGPVLFSIAVDVQEEEATETLPPIAVAPFVAAKPVADEAGVTRLVRLLADAKHPLLIAGRGARPAAEAVASLAQRCNALIGTTVQTRGLFDGRLRDAGVIGGLSTEATRAVVERADLVIAFGASLNRFTTDFGRIAPRARWASVGLADAGETFQVDVVARVHGDADDVAVRLERRLHGASSGQWSQADLGALRHEHPIAARPAGGVDVDPRELCRYVNRRLPSNRTEVVGVGHFGGFANVASRLDADGLFLAPWEFGSIGVAVPVAIGAALARPDRLTVAWEGDGSLLASLGELETLARVQANVLVIVMDDGAYLAEVRKLQLAGRSTEPAFFGRRDLAGAARALGLRAWTVCELDQLGAALDGTLSATGPSLVHVHVDPTVHQSVF